MRFIRHLFLAMLLITSACGGSDGEDGTDTRRLEDTVQIDTPAPVDTPASETTEDTEPADTAPPKEVDDTPGCAGDFCAADPDHAPDPAEWGPFPVGGTTFEIELTDQYGEPRTITVEAWYPTTEAHRDEESIINIYDDAWPEAKEVLEPQKDASPDVTVKVARDAPMRRLDGPYPMVVFSHGAYGVRYQSIFYTVPLASHGYIVVAPDHTNNVLYDLFISEGYNLDTVVESAFDRPLDSTALLDTMEERNQTEGDLFEDMIRMDQIGFTGHSFGGYTSFYMAFIDPRVKAIVAHSPATGYFPLVLQPVLGMDFKGLPEFPVPGMIMAGTLDDTLPTDVEMRPAYDKMPPPKYYLEFYDGGHYTFSDICYLDLKNLADNLGIHDAEDALEDGCADFNLSVEIAHPIINQFGIGFFNYYLRGSTDSLKYFDAAAAAPHEDEMLYLLDM